MTERDMTVASDYVAKAIQKIASSILSGYAELITRDDFLGLAHYAYLNNEFNQDDTYRGFRCCVISCAYFDKNPVAYDLENNGDITRVSLISGITLLRDNYDLLLRIPIDIVDKVFSLHKGERQELNEYPRLFDIIMIIYDSRSLDAKSVADFLCKLSDIILTKESV